MSLESENIFYHMTKDGELLQKASLNAVLEAGKKDGFTWLNYCSPTKENLSVLIDLLGLHPLSIEDCLDDNQIPKIEDYPNHTFILFNGFSYSDRVLTIHEIDMFIGSNFLVTVSRCGEKGRSIFMDIERYIKQETGNGRQGPAFLAHIILDRIVDEKFVAIEALEEELNAAEDTILESLARFNPGELLMLRRELLLVRKSLFHERENPCKDQPR